MARSRYTPRIALTEAGAVRARKLVVSTGYYDLPNLSRNSRRGPEQGTSTTTTTRIPTSERCCGDWGQEFRGDCGAGTVAARSARDARSSRRRRSIAT